MKVIGLLGSHSGVGTTHTAIMLGSYLYEMQSKRIALVEIGNQDSFSVLYNNVIGKGIEKEFSLYGVDYYAQTSRSDLLNIFGKNYNYIIMDFGNEKRNILEFIRCDIKFIVGCKCTWKNHYLHELAATDAFREQPEKINILLTLNNKRCEKKLDKYDQYYVPFQSNPWAISSELILLFDRFFRGGE